MAAVICNPNDATTWEPIEKPMEESLTKDKGLIILPFNTTVDVSKIIGDNGQDVQEGVNFNKSFHMHFDIFDQLLPNTIVPLQYADLQQRLGFQAG